MKNEKKMPTPPPHAAQGFLCVFSVTDRASFETAKEIREQVARVHDREPAPMILVGNKTDLAGARAVSAAEATALAAAWGAPYLETSAKTRTNVDQAFLNLVALVRAAKARRPPPPPKPKPARKCAIL
jgi:Ras-related protein Ral-A